jgi:hypothetical protein
VIYHIYIMILQSMAMQQVPKFYWRYLHTNIYHIYIYLPFIGGTYHICLYKVWRYNGIARGYDIWMDSGLIHGMSGFSWKKIMGFLTDL